MTTTTENSPQLTLQDCLRHAGFHEDDWPTLTASQRAIAVVMAHSGEPPRPVKRLAPVAERRRIARAIAARIRSLR